ncbi:bile acid:sodium symporter family protein [Domibacillus epiphyticus]|uniref:Bile acid:sodium symporter n=1 Tax=Domibacillus epiphyticus TaxID=1714355 RepID=A0A1V2A611_9BACI|nr:bile acid:sodium symporter [Domibacillus epiphyticus]OMP66455.1 bile acid:sodium symporter [Domibacillus epiphyticus]
MNVIANFFSKYLALFMIIVGITTYFSPVHWQSASWVPAFLLGLVIFFTGLSMNVNAIKGVSRKKKELLVITLMKWTVTVFLSVGLALLFFKDHHEITAGLILSGAVPSATAAALYSFLAGGNTSLVVAASLLDTAISPIITPLVMIGFSGQEISLSFLSLLYSFLTIVIIPLAAGLLVQRFMPAVAANATVIIKLASSVTLLLIIHTLTGSGKKYIAEQLDILPLLVAVIFVQVVFPMAAACAIGKWCKFNREDLLAAVFQVSLCNTALAAILAHEYIGGIGSIPPIINIIMNLSIGAWLANYIAGRHEKTS